MKLRYKFIIRNIDGHPVAAAVGKDNAKFRGMIKLNETGGFIFEQLFEETTVDSIIEKLTAEYDVSEEEATASVNEFINGLRDSGLLDE